MGVVGERAERHTDMRVSGNQATGIQIYKAASASLK